MKAWRPKLIPLGRGQEQNVAETALSGEAPAPFTVGNCVYSTRGALVGRPGARRPTGGFSKRGLDSAGRPQDTAVANFAATGYANPTLLSVRDAGGERPLLVTRGRAYIYEEDRWTDHLGILTARWERLAETSRGYNPQYATSEFTPAMTYDMGPGSTPGGTAATQDDVQTLLGPAGQVSSHTFSSARAMVGAGNGARCGTTTIQVHVPPGTNDLVMVTRAAGSHTTNSYTLQSDAVATGSGMGNPVVCADFDTSTTAFICYWSALLAGRLKIIQVTVATGAVGAVHNWDVLTGAGLGCWVTNTTVATNRLVVARSTIGTAGIQTRVLDMATLTDQAIDVTFAGGTAHPLRGQVVVGNATGGNCHVAYITDTGDLEIGTRSLTAATRVDISSTNFAAPAGGGVELPASNGTGRGISCFIQHQPLPVGGRVLLGLAFTKGTGTLVAPTATWVVYDIKDLWVQGTGTTEACTRDPVAVARGELDRSAVPWQPAAAILPFNGADNYRFPTLDYSDTYAPAPGDGFLLGLDGAIGLNEITLESPTVAHHRGSTVISGAVPRMVARGHLHPVGWPAGDSPQCVGSFTVATGSLPAGDYSIVACWSWVDEAGQVHRSPPGAVRTITGVTLNARLSGLQVDAPHFNEREVGNVYTELYVQPAGSQIMYLQSRVAYERTVQRNSHPDVLGVDTTQPILYTDGNVLESNFVIADGGVAAVGSRCWVSDGRSLFASRLGASGANEAPSWHNDSDTLQVDLPASAGRVITLAPLDDKLLAFCTGGVWVVTGSGPDDIGQGQAFSDPVRVSDIAAVDNRAVVATPRGVLFEANQSYLYLGSPTSGIWLVDRALGCTMISERVGLSIGSPQPGDCLTYLQEHEVLLILRTEQGAILTYDLRHNAWGTWTIPGTAGETALRTIVGLQGQVWAVATEPIVFSGPPGTDVLNATGNVRMDCTIQDIPIAGDPGDFGRCRYVRLLGDLPGTTHTLEISVLLDETGPSYQQIYTNVPTASADTSWYTRRYDPTMYLPVQKCGLLSVTVGAEPATAVWTGIELAVKPARARSRSRDNKIGI